MKVYGYASLFELIVGMSGKSATSPLARSWVDGGIGFLGEIGVDPAPDSRIEDTLARVNPVGSSLGMV